MPDDHPFALCLTHDVDRPYKGLRSLYYALRGRPRHHLGTAVRGENPYWQFEDVMALEDDLGVRSAFYFLNEPSVFDLPPTEWFRPVNWVQHLGRYDPTEGPIARVIRRLDAGGWEVGLHGSYHSYRDRRRLRHEKEALERVLGHPVRGGRQHYLRLERPDTWRHHADIGLDYDASLGSATDYGFEYGYGVKRPFGDEFVVFPLTAMEVALPEPSTRAHEAWSACEGLLREAADNDAIMSVLWHPRFFAQQEFPGYRRLYRRLVERALAMGAWVGPPGDLYPRLTGEGGTGGGSSNPTATGGVHS